MKSIIFLNFGMNIFWQNEKLPKFDKKPSRYIFQTVNSYEVSGNYYVIHTEEVGYFFECCASGKRSQRTSKLCKFFEQYWNIHWNSETLQGANPQYRYRTSGLTKLYRSWYRSSVEWSPGTFSQTSGKKKLLCTTLQNESDKRVFPSIEEDTRCQWPVEEHAKK
jgi:hypothetical protein